MNQLILIKPGEEYIEEIRAYRQEFLDHNSPLEGTGMLGDFNDIAEWIRQMRLFEKDETKPNPNWVASTQYMLVEEGGSRILGMINLRHYLNEGISETGGHIGYCVRPSERRKAYAKAMLMLALEKYREMGITKVLLTCNPDNIASARTMEACGAKFERIGIKDGKEEKRYWITL